MRLPPLFTTGGTEIRVGEKYVLLPHRIIDGVDLGGKNVTVLRLLSETEVSVQAVVGRDAHVFINVRPDELVLPG